MWMNLAWGLPYLVAVVACTLVCLLAGPKGPGTARWRVPAVAGFGLLVLQHLLQTGQTMMLYRGGPGQYLGSAWYAITGGIGVILTVAGLVLVAVAVVRGRGAAVPVALGGWGGPGPTGPPSPYPAPGPAPTVSEQNPYGQHPKQPEPGR